MIHKETDNNSFNLPVKHLFFPFTHITRNDLETILTFFPQFHCLSINKDFKNNKVLHKLFEQGKIFPHFLSSQIFTPVEQKTEQYLEWAKMHKGNERNLKLLLKENPYFTSDKDITAIKSQIKGLKKDKNPPLSHDSSFQNDLLFLKMAQLYDEQNEGIDIELKDINKLSDKLVSNLCGVENVEEKIKDKEQSIYSDSRNMMIHQRILAWFRSVNAMEIINKEDVPVLFVTANDEVFHYFESNCEDMVNILDIDNIKVHENKCKNREIWQAEFNSYLTGILQADDDREKSIPVVNDKCCTTGQIKVCKFFGGAMNHQFNVIDRQIFVCLIKLK